MHDFSVLEWEDQQKFFAQMFHEYVGSLICLIAAQTVTDEQIKEAFDHIDGLNPQFSDQKKEIAKELRDNLERGIREKKEGILAQTSN